MPLYPGSNEDIITKTVALAEDFLLMLDNTGKPYKITKTNLLARESSETETKLIGTPFGALPIYQYGQEPTSAFDGNLSNYYNYGYANGGYVGLDLGSSNTKKLTKVRIYPLSGFQTRANNAKIQGSNSGENQGYVDLFTFGETPSPSIWYESGQLSISTTYRYLRYYGADGSSATIAEIEFYGV